VVDVILSADLSHLKVFVVLDGNKQKGLEALNNSKGYVRTVLARSLKWRKVPEIHFFLDEVSENGYKIDKILREIKEENK
ncbi:30S ribosome-binding factor RbfA, partial [Mycoplasmopsis pullorum]